MKLKVVRLRKVMPPAIRMDFINLHRQLSVEMRRAERTKRKIVYLDEVVFTKTTMLMKAYSSKGTNISVN